MPRFPDVKSSVPVFLAILLAAAAAAEAGENGRFRLSREAKYWRGAREESPGAFLCRRPAVTGAWVSCDRWPDASDLRTFARDAARLSGAKTEQEKALAVWRWTRRFKVHTDGNSPAEPLAQRGTSYVTDPIKVLNVYGAHFCGGLSRVIELVWRSAGYRADRVHCGSHSMAELYYKDYDGVVRPHLFDTNFGGYMYHSSRKRLMGADEYDTDYRGGKTSWVHNEHWPWPTHRVELAFRSGEKLRRIWGNWGKPYQSHMDPKRDNRRTPLFERGPYKTRTCGNGLWTYSVDPSQRGWTDGLAEPPKGLAAGSLMPAAPGAAGSAVWHFRTPYIVSDVEVEMKLTRKSAGEVVRLHLSVDDGKTWKQVWELPAEKTGEAFTARAAICPKFKVLSTSKAPAGFHSPFGRYAYRLKLELAARERPADCRVERITFRTTVQQNFYALPQLQPGRNRITVRGKLARGAGLKITYVWDDPRGKNRKNVTFVEKTPYEYEILAAGKKWEDCVCKSITVEAVPADGKGNRTIVKEAPSAIHKLPAMKPVEYTRGRRGWWLRANGKKGPPTAELTKKISAALKGLAEVETGKKQEGADLDKLRSKEKGLNARIAGALKYLLETRDPRAFDAVRDVVYRSRSAQTKDIAVVALFLCDRKRAKDVLLDVLNNPGKVAWTDVPVKKGPQNADQHWAWAAVTIAVLAKEAGWKEAVPGLVKVLQSGHGRKHVPHAIVRVLAATGDERALPAIRKALGGKGWAAAYATLAAAKVGDRSSIGAIRKILAGKFKRGREYAAVALGKLGDRSSAPAILKMLGDADDENMRAAAARALGGLGDASHLAALRAALAVEPFPWVREIMEQSIRKLEGGTK